MKKNLLLVPVFIFCALAGNTQSVGIGINAPNASAEVDITSTTKGMLMPRMVTGTITSIVKPAKGLMVYDSVQNQLMVNIGSSTSPNWQTIVAKSGWSLSGNSGINTSTQFIGTTDNKAFKLRVNNIEAGEINPGGNLFLGLRAGQADTTGYANLAIGTDALRSNMGGHYNTAIGDSAMFHGNSDASAYGNWSNTAVGFKAMFENTTGNNNAAFGLWSLLANTTGNFNTATGNGTMAYNTVGSNNTATGSNAMSENVTGNNNTATGGIALHANNTGSNNTATGFGALYENTTASNNTANGADALRLNINGSDNTAMGYQSQYNNINGIYNVSSGYQSLLNNVAGTYNTAIGTYALMNNSGSIAGYNTAVGGFSLVKTTNSQYNTAVGFSAGTAHDMGYNNTILGANCDVSADGLYNCVAIGQGVICTASSQVTIGNSATNSYRAYANWSNISDGRFKKNIQENVPGLAFIMHLRPVTYNLDAIGIESFLHKGDVSQSIDNKDRQVAKVSEAVKAINNKALQEKESTVQTGFVAQDVEAAAKETGYDFSGVDKPKNANDFYGLRYAEFVVPLVKAVQEQQAIIEVMNKRIDALEEQNRLLQQILKIKN